MNAAVENLVAEYWAAFRSNDGDLLHRCARAVVHSDEAPGSAVYHSALFVLLHHGEFTEAKTAIERALAAHPEECSASLLPVLAHVHQRLQDIKTAHTLFEECERRGFLGGRNAFLTGTAVAVAFAAAYAADDQGALIERARRLLVSGEDPSSPLFHSAVCALISRDDLETAKAAVEHALAAHEHCAPNLLPLLAHASQRLGDQLRAHELFEECRRRDLLTGRNAFLLGTAEAVAFTAAYERHDEEEIALRATRVVDLGEAPSSEVFHAALIALLARGQAAFVTRMIERVLAADETLTTQLLPVLAHACQTLNELPRAHALFEECGRKNLLTGRNAFLTSTADAVAFTVAFEAGDEAEIVACARRVVEANGTPSSEVFHAALMALLTRGEIAFVKETVERAFETGFDASRSMLLPVLAHVYQRLYDTETSHLLYQSCERLGLLTGHNAFLAQSATDVAFAVAELAMHRARAAQECSGDSAAFQAGTLLARALYEGAFADARARAAQPAPSVMARPAPVSVRKPDFIIAGSAKCGTTYLYDLVGRSPSVWPRAPKELHYFTSMYRFGDTFYSRFFELCPDGLLCGESSPDYLDDCRDTSPIDERIQLCCPDVKIVVLLRDPALRAVSWYNQMITNDAGRGGRPGNQRLNDLTMEQLRVYRSGAALIQGHYVEPLRRFARTFGRDRLLILTLDELGDVDRVWPRVGGFLGIAPPVVGRAPVGQNSGGHGKPSSELYGALREYYEESLAALQREFGIRL